MLGDPPGLVTELAVEARELFPISAASTGYHGEHVFAEPRHQFRTNLRTQVLSRRILGRSLKFLLKFCALGWIEFKEEPAAVFQRNVIRLWQRIIFFAQRVNRADEIKWRLRIRHAPDTTFRKFLLRGCVRCERCQN